jgi:L-ribulose-5-phosphate 3-epimerase
MKSPDDISLAQWSLIEEWQAGKWKTPDFPRLAREDFDLNGIELVNTLFEVPTEGYLRQLRQNATAHGITTVLIMVDDEGDGCAPTKDGRKEFAILHRKWVDIAHYLGCHAIRTNCRGPKAPPLPTPQPRPPSHPPSHPHPNPPSIDKAEALKWAADSYHPLLEYARPAGIKILIENHGGVSNDPDWMVDLMKKINDPIFGTYPDWREPSPEFDNLNYLKRTLPYAKGMSYRNQPDDDLSMQMIELCRQGGFHGWYGIESGGRDQIKKAIRLLKAHLPGTSLP